MIAFAQSLRAWLPAFDNTHTHAMHTPYSSLRRPHTQRVQSCRVHNTRTHTRQTRTTTIQPHNVEEAPEQWLHRPTHTHTHKQRDYTNEKNVAALKTPNISPPIEFAHIAPRPSTKFNDTASKRQRLFSYHLCVCVRMRMRGGHVFVFALHAVADEYMLYISERQQYTSMCTCESVARYLYIFYMI